MYLSAFPAIIFAVPSVCHVEANVGQTRSIRRSFARKIIECPNNASRHCQNSKNNSSATMVKVWYEPPPYGPGTSLNRPSYGVIGAKPQFIQLLSRRPQGMLIAGACAAFAAIAYIPISECNY